MMLPNGNWKLLFRPKLYFVKVDVQACFDTIEQGKLLGARFPECHRVDGFQMRRIREQRDLERFPRTGILECRGRG